MVLIFGAFGRWLDRFPPNTLVFLDLCAILPHGDLSLRCTDLGNRTAISFVHHKHVHGLDHFVLLHAA